MVGVYIGIVLFVCVVIALIGTIALGPSELKGYGVQLGRLDKEESPDLGVGTGE